MPPEEIEQRVRLLESNHGKIEVLIQHLNNSIDEIRDSIKEALDLRGDVKNHSGQLNKLWPKVDQVAESVHETNRALDALVLTCEACRKNIEADKQWKGTRFGNLADWVIKIGAIAILGYAFKEGIIK